MAAKTIYVKDQASPMWARAQALADAEGKSLSAFIEDAIRAQLDPHVGGETRFIVACQEAALEAFDE